MDMSIDTNITVTSVKTRIDHDGSTNEGVRVFSYSPECTALQIRTCGSVTFNGGGKKRPAFSHALLSAADIRQLMAALQLELTRLEAHNG
jgi:hypothetical protein